MAVEREEILGEVEEKADKLAQNKFERCFEPVEETFRKKPTGNKILAEECGWCKYRYKCWPSVQELPSLASQAKNPPMVAYIEIADEYKEEQSKTDSD